MTDRLAGVLLLLLVIFLPFEFRAPPPWLSNLQILFVVFALLSLPRIVRRRRELLANPVVMAALLFVAISWIAALASGNAGNAAKAAVRYSAGGVLLCAVLLCRETTGRIREAWTIAALAAAVYGLLDYFGLGFPALFRPMEFYFADVRRLSGSFDYPNCAAAYYAISLPIVWKTVDSVRLRILCCAVLWAALLLTFSRAAVLAVVAVAVVTWLAGRSRAALQVGAACAIVFALVSLYRPLNVTRFTGSPPRGPERSAQYGVDFNRMGEHPGRTVEMPVRMRNAGTMTWPSRGPGQFVVSYHWYDTVQKRILEIVPLETPLPHDVRPNQSVSVIARFETPSAEGLYLLDWDIKYPEFNWFSMSDGVLPGVVEVQIAADVEPWRGNGDLSAWLHRPADDKPALPDVSRRELWGAALLLFGRHPILGIGPDNYRLSYGEALSLPRSDSNIHSNNLYLEILVGCGVPGLLAFALLLSRIRWRDAVSAPSLAVFLIHGVFDFFLMTTPLYFAFWILVAQASETPQESQ